jgi:hypothetical protein
MSSHHLSSVGSADTRGAAKTRVVEGTTIYKILAGGSGSIEGKFVPASQGNKTRYLLKVAANTYRGEVFINYGSRVDVATTYFDKTRSELGTFIRAQDAAIRQGLLAGVLSTAWPLLQDDVAKRLEFAGMKKVERQGSCGFPLQAREGIRLGSPDRF